MNTSSTLQVKSLQKHFKARAVVKDISFHINSGEIVGLLGPNGAGKTTSFYMVVGLIAPDKDHVFVRSTRHYSSTDA